ncbi:MAG: metallophosphoesterase family protein [Acidimicrobiales bacterium]
MVKSEDGGGTAVNVAHASYRGALPRSAKEEDGHTTVDATILPTSGHTSFYHRLEMGLGEPPVALRVAGDNEHAGHDAGHDAGRLAGIEPLLAFVHLTDLHVTDVQSPARAEFLDRLGNVDSALFRVLGNIGTYRPQDMLSMHVVETMARTVRNLHFGPTTGHAVAFAMITGDAVDNSQHNELQWYLDLMNGGKVITPDSGDLSRYEGIGSAAFYDWHYWHPDDLSVGIGADIARERYGYPEVAGLLDSCRKEFTSTGLGIPWHDVPGNHDFMLAGTIPHNEMLRSVATGSRKLTGWVEGTDMGALLANHSVAPPDVVAALSGGPEKRVTADPERRLIDREQWLAARNQGIGGIDGADGASGYRKGYGGDYARAASNGEMSQSAPEGCRSYYGFDAGLVRCLVLDTVNTAGGWQGSLDAEQLSWLEGELVNGHSRWRHEDGGWVTSSGEDRLFVLFNHHPLETLVNDYSPSGSDRILAGSLEGLLARFPNVILLVNGHTHRHKITLLHGAPAAHGAPAVGSTYSGHRIWQVTTASLIDWPQQGRVIELCMDRGSGELVIYSSVFDHAGMVNPRMGDLDDPLVLAGWSRELSLNSWHRSDPVGEPPGRGTIYDRNVMLRIPAPFALA